MKSLEELIPGGLDYRKFLSPNYVVLDIETTNINKGDPLTLDNRIIHISYYIILNNNIYNIIYNNNIYNILEQLFLDINKYNLDYIVCHNTKFEIGWLLRQHLQVHDVLWACTMLAEKVILGNNFYNLPLDLDSTAARYGAGNKSTFISKAIKAGVCPSELPYSKVAEYCTNDVDITWKVWKQQQQILAEKELLPVFYTRCIVTPVLADIESKGMHLDKAKVETEYARQIAELRTAGDAIRDEFGEINYNSPDQVGSLLYDDLKFSEVHKYGRPVRTDKDKRKTDLVTVASLKAKNKRQRRFLELYHRLNDAETKLSKSLYFFLGVVNETPDSIFHATYNQHVAKTHRFSSTARKLCLEIFDRKPKGVQLQNVPREYKSLFSPRYDGWRFTERDYSQLEFRVAGFIGGDEQVRYDVTHKIDIHSFTARTITEAGQPTDRQGAKQHTFKPLYGGESGTEAERAYYTAFKEKYSGVAQAQEKWKHIVEATKELRIPSGLIFYWPDTKWNSTGTYLVNTSSICNFPVQSFATADIVPIGLTIFWHRIKEFNLKSFIVNTIHDSIETEEHPEEGEKMSELGELSMINGVIEYLQKVYNVNFDIPLEIETKTGDYWNG